MLDQCWFHSQTLSLVFKLLNAVKHVFTAERQSSTDDDYEYEYVSSVVKDTSSPFAPGGLGE